MGYKEPDPATVYTQVLWKCNSLKEKKETNNPSNKTSRSVSKRHPHTLISQHLQKSVSTKIELLSVVKAGYFFSGDQMKYLPKFSMPLLLFGKMDHALI